jgi:hypothetical protein
MRSVRAFFLCGLWAVQALVAGQSLGENPSGGSLEEAERVLGTGGPINRSFHELVKPSEAFGLRHEAYLIGIEKANRRKLGLGEGPDDDSGPVNLQHGTALHQETREQLRRVLSDPRRLFVSHLVRYDADAGSPRFLFNAYCRVEAARDYLGTRCPDSGRSTRNDYLASFAALDALGDDLSARLREARQAGRPYTHLLVLAMGWNTDQRETVEGYNQLLDGLRSEAKDPGYRPLAIGVTWPSGWKNLILVPFSYGTKAKDADEAGAVWLNYLANRTLPRALARESPAPHLVLIGHSFGARLLTRAVFSHALLAPQDRMKLERPPALVVALQGAFSANRFLAERTKGREGAPYSTYREVGAHFALTWSRRDKANPVANFVSNANQVGGKPGYERARRHRNHFRLLEAVPTLDTVVLEPEAEPASISDEGRIAMIDASRFVTNHGDIHKPEMSRLLWRLIRDRFPPPPRPNQSPTAPAAGGSGG